VVGETAGALGAGTTLVFIVMLRCTREALVPVGSARRAVWWVAQASKRASFREGCSWANESRRTSVHQRVESVSPAFDRRRHRVCQARSSTRQDAQLLYSTTTWNAKHGCGQIPLVFAAVRRRSLSNTATLSHFAEPPTTASRAVSSPSSARPDSRDARSAQLVLPSRYPCTSTPRPRWGQPPSSTPFQRSVATRHQWFAGPSWYYCRNFNIPSTERPALRRLSIKSDRVVGAWGSWSSSQSRLEADWGGSLVHLDSIRARKGTTTPNLPARAYLCSAKRCCGSCLTSAGAALALDAS
jgi:hypothetical protein